MSKRITTVEDGPNGYALTRNEADGTAKLAVTGNLTPKLAKDLIEDLTPLAGGAKKRGMPRQRQATALRAPGDAKDEGAS